MCKVVVKFELKVFWLKSVLTQRIASEIHIVYVFLNYKPGLQRSFITDSRILCVVVVVAESLPPSRYWSSDHFRQAPHPSLLHSSHLPSLTPKDPRACNGAGTRWCGATGTWGGHGGEEEAISCGWGLGRKECCSGGVWRHAHGCLDDGWQGEERGRECIS